MATISLHIFTYINNNNKPMDYKENESLKGSHDINHINYVILIDKGDKHKRMEYGDKIKVKGSFR